MKTQAVITGSKVHDVGYRIFLLQKALRFGLLRFDASNEVIRGMSQVVVLAEGEPAIIEAFCSCIRSEYPPDAIVSDVSFEEYSGYIISLDNYQHLIQVEQMNKGVHAIISIDKKQDRMLDKQDQMLGKQDQMIQTLDHMGSSITGEIKDLRTDLRSYLDRKFSVMEQDIQQIKIKIGLM